MPSRLNPGDSLTVGEVATSESGRFALTLQADGNLVLYDAAATPRWATGKVGDVARAVMQEDGNFVLEDTSGALWATATDGHPGSFLSVQDDGHIVIYGPDGPVWASSKLNPHQTLEVGGFVTSQDGQSSLHLQEDGNLVHYHSGAATWATGTRASGKPHAEMQDDGNFVLYEGSDAAFATGTEGHPDSYLSVQNDGNVVIYGPEGALWASDAVVASDPPRIVRFDVDKTQIDAGDVITISWQVVSSPPLYPPIASVTLTQKKHNTNEVLSVHSGLAAVGTFTDKPEISSDYYLEAQSEGGAVAQQHISVIVQVQTSVSIVGAYWALNEGTEEQPVNVSLDGALESSSGEVVGRTSFTGEHAFGYLPRGSGGAPGVVGHISFVVLDLQRGRWRITATSDLISIPITCEVTAPGLFANINATGTGNQCEAP